jgi:hypothetical protein
VQAAVVHVLELIYWHAMHRSVDEFGGLCSVNHPTLLCEPLCCLESWQYIYAAGHHVAAVPLVPASQLNADDELLVTYSCKGMPLECRTNI